MTKRLRRSAFAALLVTAATIAGEAGARVDDWIRLGVPITHTPDYDHDLKYLDWFGVRGRPNGHYRRWALDNYGFRGPDIGKEKRYGCVRIITVGASETFGMYESNGHEYPAQLRDSLRSRGCFEVINAGIVGAGIPSIVRLWENYLLQFHADVVVVYTSPVVYLSAATPSWPPFPGKADSEKPTAPASRLLDHLHAVWETPDFIQRRRVKRWIAADTHDRPAGWFFRTAPDDRLLLFTRDLDSLVKDIRLADATPVIVTHAMRFTVPPSSDDSLMLLSWRRYYPRATTTGLLDMEMEGDRRVRTYAAAHCVHVVDAAARMTGTRRYFADFVHFTDQGSAALAALLVPEIVHIAANRGGALGCG